MTRPALQQGVDLFQTGGAAGDHLAVGDAVGPELVAEAAPHVHTDLVVVGLVPEAAGHPAALGLGGDDVVAAVLQDGDGVGLQPERPLLAVAVVSESVAVGGRQRLRLGTVVKEPVDVLKDLVAVLGERGERLAVDELLVLALEHRVVAGLDDHHVAAILDVGSERLGHALGVVGRRRDHPL